MKPRVAFIMGVICFFSTAVAMATVKPALENLVKDSKWIIVGKVVEVIGPGEEFRTVHIRPQRILKGDFGAIPKQVTINYQRIGKGDIFFQKMKELKKNYIFYFTGPIQAKSGSWELTDAWFGVEPASWALERKIKKTISQQAD